MSRPRPFDHDLARGLARLGIPVDPLLLRSQQQDVAPDEPGWFSGARERARERGLLVRHFPDAHLTVK